MTFIDQAFRPLAALLLALAVVGVVTHPAQAADGLIPRGISVDGRVPPKIQAQSWVIADAKTGEVLAAKNAHERLRPASTLKTLTADTLLPRLNLSDRYRVRWADAHVAGSAVGIVPGSRYSINQLFYGMFLPSGNDAARALASAAGSLPHTVRLMNAKAHQLGADDTHAVNPTGLDGPGQWSSAFDLAVFARAGLTNPDFRRYVSTISTSFPAEEPKKGHHRKSYMIYNQNPLLVDGYRGTLGVKTGYTTQAGNTFVGAVHRGGRTLIVTLMAIGEPSETAAERLFEWGFKHADHLKPVGSLDPAVPASAVAATPGAGGAAASGQSVTTSQADVQQSGGPGAATWWAAGAVALMVAWLLRRRWPVARRS